MNVATRLALRCRSRGSAGQWTRITSQQLLRRLPRTATEYGLLMETFVVNEVLQQASWQTVPWSESR